MYRPAMSLVFTGLLAVFLLAAPGARAAADPATPEYSVVDGAVRVFGHRLETENPLPEIGDCEGCGKIGFAWSPGGRWALIISDVRFIANDIWLYDSSTGAKPVHLAGKRLGRHLTTTWFSDRVFELRWSGMGYSTSLLFDAAAPGTGRALDDLLFYDAARDVYMRYLYDEAAASDMVEIGAVFAPPAPAERFRVSLAGFRRPDAVYEFRNIEVAGANLTFEYINSAGIAVPVALRPGALSAAR